MPHLTRFLFWLMRAWPVLALLPVGFAHLIALRVLPADSILVNKLVGMSSQVLGGLLVLYSVNDNLGLYRAQSLISAVFEWVKSFPLAQTPVSLSANIHSIVTGTASMTATVFQVVNTIEERIAKIEIELKELETQLKSEVQAINKQIASTKTELQNQLLETSSLVAHLSKRLEHVAVGGFKFQALGVLLAIYGAVTSVFA